MTKFARRRWLLLPAGALVAVAAVITGALVAIDDDDPKGPDGGGRPIDDPADVVGDDVHDAREQLSDAGFEVDVSETPDESVPEGRVLEAERRDDGTILLTVARWPVDRYLRDIRPAASSAERYRFGAFNLSGSRYTRALQMPLDACGLRTSSIEYDLSRDYQRLMSSTVGLDDASSSDARIRIEVFLGDELAQSDELDLGEALPINLDVENELRLRIVATLLGDEQDCHVTAAAVLADPYLVTFPWEVAGEPGGE